MTFQRDVGRLRRAIGLLLFGLAALLPSSPATAASADLDLPVCEAMAPGGAAQVALGIVDPAASPEVTQYAVRLARVGERLSVCSESWSAVLPHWVPWSAALERGYGFGFFVLGFLLAALLAWRFTPPAWWRRPTLVGLLFLGSITWVSGVAAMAVFHAAGGQRLFYTTPVSVRAAGAASPQWLDVRSARDLEVALAPHKLLESLSVPQQAVVAADAPLPEVQPQPQGSYRVHQRLNFRQRAGVDAARQTVLAAGDSVVYDGARENDWWRVRTASGQVGWVNSIWLRRLDEAAGKSATGAGKS